MQLASSMSRYRGVRLFGVVLGNIYISGADLSNCYSSRTTKDI